MAKPIDRSVEARATRRPDLFLSHSSRDKKIVRTLAQNLSWCGLDVWLDEWELQVGDSLQDVLAQALSRAKFVGVVVGGNFSDSPWANDELKIGLARERHEGRKLVLPIVVGRQVLPAFLQDRIFIDLRRKRYEGITRLAGMLYKVPKQTIEDAIAHMRPTSIASVVGALRFAGIDPPIALAKEDVQLILKAGGHKTSNGCVEFSPRELENSPNLPPRLAQLMKDLQEQFNNEPA